MNIPQRFQIRLTLPCDFELIFRKHFDALSSMIQFILQIVAQRRFDSGQIFVFLRIILQVEEQNFVRVAPR